MGDAQQRFWTHVQQTETCWWWTGAVDTTGYGRVRRHKVCYPAHRLAWIDAHGPVPEGLYVCHRCDRKLCVRPDHLFLGTARDNTVDMVTKGRHGRQTHPERFRHLRVPLSALRRGEQNRNAKLTVATVRAIREEYAAGASQQVIADRYGVHQGSISSVIRRTTWAHVA